MKTTITRAVSHPLTVLACFSAVSVSAWAGNALNVIGFGAESEMMGGADVAVTRDVGALAINPAGLTQIENRRMDIFTSPYVGLDLGHDDSVGNKQKSYLSTGLIGGGGYARRVSPTVVVGAGLFVQGGTGFGYRDFDSGFGPVGELSSQVGIMKLAPGLGWQVDERLAVGIALNMLYATSRQKQFDESSITNAQVPAASFYGSRTDGLSAFGLGATVGLRYQLSAPWVLGISYATKVPLHLRGGQMTVNYEALGEGKVRYRDTHVDGLGAAQNLSAGLAWQATPRWLLAADFSWLDWSDAVSTIRTTASQPQGSHDPAKVPATVSSSAALNFRDQFVIALGASYQLGESTRIRAGYNHGRDPTDHNNLTPLFAVVANKHYTLGVIHSVGRSWELGAGVQYQPRRKVRYSNPAAPFTADARERNEAIYPSLSVSRRW